MSRKSKYQKLQDGEWKSSLRTGSLSDKPRRITSDYHMARVAARKLRKAGAKKEANQMFAQAEMMKLAGHPTVKSQAFVDAEQYAMAKGGMGSAAQDAYEEFLRNRNRNRNRNRPRIDMGEPRVGRGPAVVGGSSYDLGHPALMMPSNFIKSETGSGMDARLDPNSSQYLGTPQERIREYEEGKLLDTRMDRTSTR